MCAERRLRPHVPLGRPHSGGGSRARSSIILSPLSSPLSALSLSVHPNTIIVYSCCSPVHLSSTAQRCYLEDVYDILASATQAMASEMPRRGYTVCQARCNG